MEKTMTQPSAYDVYQFYLDADDLKGQSHNVKVAAAKIADVYDPVLRKKKPTIILAFENRKKVMTLNKTQAGAMIDITGTDDYTKWVGTEIILTPAMASNNRKTIAVTTKANGTQK